MKDPERSNKKTILEFRKQSVSEKIRSQNPSGIFLKQEAVIQSFVAPHSRNMRSMGRKYVQENIFKPKPEKQHREVVISDELIKSSKLYRLLKDKMELNDALFVKDFNELAEIRTALKKEISQIKTCSYNSKLSLWQLKNQMLELKAILNEEEQESKRLQKELQNAERNEQAYFQDNQIECDGEEGQNEEGGDQNENVEIQDEGQCQPIQNDLKKQQQKMEIIQSPNKNEIIQSFKKNQDESLQINMIFDGFNFGSKSPQNPQVLGGGKHIFLAPDKHKE